MRNLKIVFPSGSAFDNYKFTIDEDEELKEDYKEKLEKKKLKKENSEEFED